MRRLVLLLLAGTCLEAAAQPDPGDFGVRLRAAALRDAVEGVRKGTCVRAWPTRRLRAYCEAAVPQMRAAVAGMGALDEVRLRSRTNEAALREETWVLTFERGRIVLTAGVKDGDNEYLRWAPGALPSR